MAHHIALIGAGPRGTYCLRRLMLQLCRHPLPGPVHIHVIEKSGKFGGGGIHSPTQPEYLLLNTIGSQITAFGDDDAEARASAARKTLHGYLVDQGISIGPNDYPSRARHGRYLAAMFDWIEAKRPPGVTVHRHCREAVDIEPGKNGAQLIRFEDGSAVAAHEILLLTGHAKNRIVPGSLMEAWAQFAEGQQQKGRNVSYVNLVYPVSEKTAHIEPGETVYVIGMGLTAVDVVKTLTYGRAGRFETDRYTPSGKEPYVILGSRLGMPYSARGRNQKSDQYKGRIFTREAVEAVKARKSKVDFKEDLLSLMIREMEFVYYSTMLGPRFGEDLLTCGDEPARKRLIEERIRPEDRFSWEALARPMADVENQAKAGAPWFESLEAYTRFVLDAMAKDIEEASLGNMASPLKNAVDSVLRDLRDHLRLAVDGGGLSARSHRFLDREFNRINNRAAVGPPVSSTRELLLLAEAGLLSFSGPSPRLEADENSGCFVLESGQVAGSRRQVQHVLNGRIHGVDNKNDTSPLIRSLYRRGLIRNFVNEDETGRYELGGLDVDDEFHLIGNDGTAHPHVCALGIPLEGKFWFNAADARPDVNSNAVGQLSRWAAGAVERLRRREG
ncbi:MAG: FAD/NAD(P)-binding protein [Desulfobacterales bacterium]|nr:FAD/NAD(P)-binding protein [Desulfobacterales bacterium]